MKEKTGSSIFLSTAYCLLAVSLNIVFMVLLAGCGSSKTNPDNSEKAGGVSRNEFNRLSPTYGQISRAYEVITQANPNIEQDTVRFPRILFDEMKNQTRKTSTRGRDALDLLEKLTWEEWKVIITNPVSAILGIKAAPNASSGAHGQYPCDAIEGFANNKADAVRHAYWNALMAKRASSILGTEQGLLFALQLASAHETDSQNSPKATAMDLSNNAAGRRVFKENSNASDAQLLELIVSLPFAYVEENESITFDDTRLVYFAGKRVMDGSWNGTFTNPDSGGPWQVTYYFNQCENVIRGEFHATRGSSKAKRRFVGTISGNQLKLDIAYPFEWESPNTTPCDNVQATLNISGDNITGPWTSSNCRQGGAHALSKALTRSSQTIYVNAGTGADVCAAPTVR